MSLEATIKCDADGCYREFAVEDPYNISIERELDEDWHQDPDNYEYHYCASCWEKIKEEMEGESDD